MMCKISVVVPAYNAEKYIAKCLGSLKSQSFSDFEVIVVIDGATDDTESIVDSFVSADSRFVKICQENSGAPAARNNGISVAVGEYITFVDSDDYVSPDHLQNLFDGIRGTELSVCGYVTERPDGTETGRQTPKDGLSGNDALISAMIISDEEIGGYCINKLYVADVIKSNGIRFIDGEKYMFEDIAFNFDYMRRIKSGRCLPLSTYHYVHYDNEGMSRSTAAGSKWFHYVDLLDRIIDENDTDYPEFLYKVRMARVWHSATAVRVLAHHKMTGTDEYRRMRGYIKKDLFAYLKCRTLPAKKRLGGLLSYVCPRLAFTLWNRGRG